jgi:hypothetical protein
VVIGVDIVVEDRRHVEEIVVIWIDHKALQHCFVVVSVFQDEEWLLWETRKVYQ